MRKTICAFTMLLLGLATVVSTAGPASAIGSGSGLGLGWSPPPTPSIAGVTPTSFWLAGTNGNVWNFGGAATYGSAAGLHLTHAVVGITPTGDGQGYWLVASDGGVFSFGDAGYFGSTGAVHLTQPVVGLTPTTDGQGYWLVASDGGVFSFGDAGYFGSTGAVHLTQPVVGLVPTPDGQGYWLIAADGGVFSFGDAGYFGSTGALALTKSIVALAPTPDGQGYWLIASDGGVFAFGDAGFFGSAAATPSPDPAQKLVPTADGQGYWIVDQNGTAQSFGDATGAPPTQGLLFQPHTAGDRALLFAFAQLGKPYIWGGNGPVGYDCSGLALASWQHGAGVSFARVSKDQYHTAGVPVPLASLEAGDLVFWGSNSALWSSVYHTAMYVGGGRIVESTGGGVQLNSLIQWGQSAVMPMGRRP